MEIVEIQDYTTRAKARILPELGFNCFQFTAMFEGRPVEVLWAEPGFEDSGGRASGSGIPILFPYPGRLQGIFLNWGNTAYMQQPGDGRGNAIHGFVHERPWRVRETSESHAVGEFQASVDHPPLIAAWPADFKITANYRMGHNSLEMKYTLENPAETELPCGFGIHPYFRLPLGGNDAGACRVTVPAARRWKMNEMIATGERLPLTAETDLTQGKRFDEMQLDTGFSDLAFDGDACRAAIEDPGSGRRLTLSFDRSFPECVVYNPAHREAVCIEPYSCISDPFRLHSEGIDAGLWVLAPGESREARVTISVE